METELQSLKARPRFRKALKAPIENVVEAFVDVIHQNPEVRGSCTKQHLFIRLPQEKEGFLTPRLSIAIEEIEGGTLLRGLYGPRPSIWTAIIFAYAMISFGTIAVLFWGFTQSMSNEYAFAFWFVPGGVLTIGGLYLATQFGQKLGYPQMETLHGFYKNAIKSFEEMNYEPEED